MPANFQLSEEELRDIERQAEARRIAANEFETRSSLIARGPDGQMVSSAPENGRGPDANVQNARGRESHIQRLAAERDKQMEMHSHAVERARVKHEQDIARDRQRHIEQNRRVLERDIDRVAGLARLEHSAEFHREAERFERESQRELHRYSRDGGLEYSPEYIANRERYLASVDAERQRLQSRDHAVTERDREALARGGLEDHERKRIFQADQSRDTAIDRLTREADRAREADTNAAERLAAIDARERSEPVVDMKFADQANRLDLQLQFEVAERQYHLQDRLAWMAGRDSEYREQHEAKAHQAYNDRLAVQQRCAEYDRDVGNQFAHNAAYRSATYGAELQQRVQEENRLVAEKSAELAREAQREREEFLNRPSALDLWAKDLEARDRANQKQEPDRVERLKQRDERAGSLEDRRNEREMRSEVKPPEPKELKGYSHKVERDHVAYSREAEPDKSSFKDYGKRISVQSRDDESRRAALQLASERFSGFRIKGSEEFVRESAKHAFEMGLADRVRNPELKDYFKELAAQKQEREQQVQAQAKAQEHAQAKAQQQQSQQKGLDKTAAPEKTAEPVKAAQPELAKAAPEKEATPEPAKTAEPVKDSTPSKDAETVKAAEPTKSVDPERQASQPMMENPTLGATPLRAQPGPDKSAPDRTQGQTGEQTRTAPVHDWRDMTQTDHQRQHEANEAKLRSDLYQANKQPLAQDQGQKASVQPERQQDEPKAAPTPTTEQSKETSEAPSRDADVKFSPDKAQAGPQRDQAKASEPEKAAEPTKQPEPAKARDAKPVQEGPNVEPVAEKGNDQAPVKQAEFDVAPARDQAEPAREPVADVEHVQVQPEPAREAEPAHPQAKSFDWGPDASDPIDREVARMRAEREAKAAQQPTQDVEPVAGQAQPEKAAELVKSTDAGPSQDAPAPAEPVRDAAPVHAQEAKQQAASVEPERAAEHINDQDRAQHEPASEKAIEPEKIQAEPTQEAPAPEVAQEHHAKEAPTQEQAEPERTAEPDAQAQQQASTPEPQRDQEEDQWASFADGLQSSNDAGRDSGQDRQYEQEQDQGPTR